MKILMSSILDFSGEVNGVVVSTHELADALNDSGHDVQIITPYHISSTSFLYQTMTLSASIFKTSNASWLMILNLIAKIVVLFRMTSKFRKGIEVFHAHDVFSAAVFLFFKKPDNKVLLQTHFHCMPWDEFAATGYVKAESLSYRLLKAFSQYVLHHPAIEMVHVSEMNRQYVDNKIIAKKDTGAVLYPGLKEVTPTVDMTAEKPYLVNVGKLNARKNQRLLIDILAELKNLGIEVPLYLVGPEDSEEKELLIQRCQSQNVSGQVHFCGQQDRTTTTRLLSNASLYVHTSLSESIGRTLIEAIQLHTPVVALDYPALQEIIFEKAILNRELTAREMSPTIAHFLLEDDKRKELQESQYSRFQARFTQAAMLESYNTIITNNENQ